MKILTKPIIKRAAAIAAGMLFPAAIPAASAQGVSGPTTGSPQIISNTALAEWDSGPNRLSRPSNTVDIPVEQPPAAPPELTIYHFASPPGAIQENLPTTMCLGSGGAQPVELTGAFDGLNTSPASLEPATAIRAGEPLVLGLEFASENVDPTAIDEFTITITTPNGDEESIILVESAPNSGRFLGMINTRAIPPSPIQRDCLLSVSPGDQLNVDLDNSVDGSDIAVGSVDILIDPFGLAFDSADGAPVDGTRITIVDAATGAPAEVFGDDSVSSFPSTIIAGSTVTDAGGQVYDFPSGFYRFPFLRPGDYRLVVEPPAPFTHPSDATPADIARLTRPDGGQFEIAAGSFGGIITLDDPEPVRIDIPLDQPGGVLQINKITSTQRAVPGDVVQYRVQVSNPDPLRASGIVTITDQLPIQMRLRSSSVRYNGEIIAADIAGNGQNFSVLAPSLAPGESGLLTYLAEVRQDARTGTALNLASASDSRGAVSDTVDAAVQIERDGISERFTLIGRVTDGGCTIDPRKANGIAGVRVMLQDGSFTITDEDGRYHFEGLIPGIHVVQVDPNSFPLDQRPVDCARNTRSAGSDISRFVEGRGGILKRADFRAIQTELREPISKAVAPLPTVISDAEAAGAEKDWFAGQKPGIGFLFPATDHNPRVKAIRVAVKHFKPQKVELSVNGKRVDNLNFDGTKKDSTGKIRVSIWRGVNLQDGNNVLTARILDRSGNLVEEVTTNVHFATPPVRAELVKEKSVLIADGIARPRIAVRLTDRYGKPIQHGSVGAFDVNAPYAAAVEVDAQQANQLSGLERADPVWRVIGDEGIAYVELEPTTASGSLSVQFSFADGEVTRQQRVESWLDPGDRPWTVVGFAAGTIGFNKLEDGLEELADDDVDDLNVDGRISLYAKGRVTGKWLLTLAYDSDKEEDETLFTGVIDPRSFYTIYADRTEQRYDAASIRRLYLKLERPQFYALFGDYNTGIDEPELARYNRAYNGIKAEYRSEQLHLQAFAADTPFRFRREEIQGNGLTGPYALATRDILPNSERIVIETRDRIRSDRIVDSKQLLRHIDYDIDYLAGTLRFREPILSRDSGLNPQFIIAEYEVFGVGERVNNAGGRAKWQTKDGKLQIAATAIHDETDVSRTNLVGADIRFKPGTGTEIRAEIAHSDSNARAGSTGVDNSATSWLVEVEHHDEVFDVLAYVRETGSGFGVGQINAGEIGTRKYGVDARVRLNNKVSLSASAFQEDYLSSDTRRRAASAEVEYRTGDTTLRAGIAHANDRLDDGTTNKSTIAKAGASQKLLDNKLEINAQTEFALGGQDESIDFPARHTVGARYAVTNDIQLIGSYEIADGENIDARTARIGFDVAPWAGARVTASANRQDINEFGPRSFASYGLAQSFRVDDNWSLDFSLDGNKTLGGFDADDVLNPLQPVASGGFLGSDGSLTEDFTAVTGGATYRGEKWSWTSRAEYRDGETTNRYGITSAVLRETGEGEAIGGLVSWFRANQIGGVSTTTAEAELSWAHRPADSRWSFLNKLEYRYDAVRNAVSGLPGPIGGASLTIDGDARSQRLINSTSINYSPIDLRIYDDGRQSEFVERGEYAAFIGLRYVTDRFGEDDVKGFSAVVGGDLRFDLSDVADIGVAGTVRIGTDARNIAYSGGPVLTVSPAKNSNISLGYNIIGFEDRDFEESRYTRSGPFLTFKLKFDQETLGGLGF